MRIASVHPYFKKLTRQARASAPGVGPWSVTDLCRAYSWPTGLVGGTTIAIIELGGGWVASDMVAFFASIGQPVPSIAEVSVDGTTNTPGGEADGEVALDLQVAAAAYFAATGKPASIRLYWCQDIAAGVRSAYKDGCDVCSISWGADEANWGPDAAKDMDAAASEALAAGMIVFAAAGDNDSSDGGPNAANVDCPASCPNVVGCGGTTKTLSAEVVWNNSPGNAEGSGTGGGYSTVFPMPIYQCRNGAPTGPGRMVPDVAANADPSTGYQIFYGGSPQVIGGTSAVAPLYAGLFAAFGPKQGAGIVARLWGNRPCFADITQGDNGMYRAAVGPDPCTGLGAPVGNKLAAVFPETGWIPPQTPTSPSLTAIPPVLSLHNAIAWACSQLPHMFMTHGTAAKHIATGLTKNWPSDGVSPDEAVKLFDQHFKLLAKCHDQEVAIADATQQLAEAHLRESALTSEAQALRARDEQHTQAMHDAANRAQKQLSALEQHLEDMHTVALGEQVKLAAERDLTITQLRADLEKLQAEHGQLTSQAAEHDQRDAMYAKLLADQEQALREAVEREQKLLADVAKLSEDLKASVSSEVREVAEDVDKIIEPKPEGGQ